MEPEDISNKVTEVLVATREILKGVPEIERVEVFRTAAHLLENHIQARSLALIYKVTFDKMGK